MYIVSLLCIHAGAYRIYNAQNLISKDKVDGVSFTEFAIARAAYNNIIALRRTSALKGHLQGTNPTWSGNDSRVLFHETMVHGLSRPQALSFGRASTRCGRYGHVHSTIRSRMLFRSPFCYYIVRRREFITSLIITILMVRTDTLYRKIFTIIFVTEARPLENAYIFTFPVAIITHRSDRNALVTKDIFQFISLDPLPFTENHIIRYPICSKTSEILHADVPDPKMIHTPERRRVIGITVNVLYIKVN